MKGYVNGVGYEWVKRGISGNHESRTNIGRNAYSHQNDGKKSLNGHRFDALCISRNKLTASYYYGQYQYFFRNT